jgi:hypothetical protein
MTITHKLNSENYTDKLSDGIEFIKLDSGKIAKVKNTDHIDLNCDFASISCDNCTTTSDYYEYLKDLLNNNIPDELKKYTILDFTYTESNKDKFNDEFKTFVSPVGGEKKGFINNYLDLLESKGVTDSNLKTIEKILEENNKDNSLDPSAEQYEENFKAIEDYYNFLKNQTIDINYNTYDGGDNKKHYQTTVYDYLNKVDNYVSYLEKVQKNTEKEKIKTIQNFTKDLLDSLDIYYGSGRNSFIVNIKDFKALSDDLGDKENKTTTKEVFSSEIFLRDFYKLDPVKDYTDRDLDIGTYIISLSNVDTENKKANITFNSINNSKLTNAIDIYNNKEDLKNNLFFKYPINASYYIHSNIPFNRRGSPLGMNESSLIDSKNYTTNRYFEDIQKGYVLSLEDNLYKLNLNYADIRPIQLITNYPFSYKIDYVLSDELIPLTSTQKWKATYNNRDIYKSYNIDKETTYTLNKIQGKDTLFRNTYFVYNKLNTTSNNQLELSSTINLNPSLEEIRSEKLTDSLSENFLYSYMVPKELNSNSLTFEKIIDNIENKNICFNIEDQKMNFWINPAKPDSFIDLKMSNEE